MKQVSLKTDHLALEVLEYGAILRKLKFRTGANTWADMCVYLPAPEDYLTDPFNIGACVGRFAGRLSGGNLELAGKSFSLANSGGVTLHGGERGFSKRYWKIHSVLESADKADKAEVSLTYRSAHLEEGFPGNLDVKVTYTLNKNVLSIRHEATTDRTTIVNLTNHTYFKLDSQPLISHYRLKLNAGKRAETSSRLLPTGQLLGVNGTPYDFQTERSLGDFALDTPFLLKKEGDYAARLTSTISGIRMTLRTDQPALVIYTPDAFAGICLETQNLPDAPRFSHFPDARLHPGETYLNESHFIFESIL